jgi:hypothetical protein
MDNRDALDHRISTQPGHAMLDGGSVLAISTLENAAEPKGVSGFSLTDMVGHAASDALTLAVLEAAGATAGVGNWPSAREASTHITELPRTDPVALN